MSMLNGTDGTSTGIGTQYLNLLITQLQHQDPMEPMDTEGMTQQLSSLAQLSQLESIRGDMSTLTGLLGGMSDETGSAFGKVLQLTQLSQGVGLLGKTVVYREGQGDSAVQKEGTIDSVELTADGIRLRAGSAAVRMDDVVSVR